MEVENLRNYFKNVISENCKGLIRTEYENQKFLFIVLGIGVLGILVGLIAYIKSLDLESWISKLLIGVIVALFAVLVFIVSARLLGRMS